jgi:hypothetical protein
MRNTAAGLDAVNIAYDPTIALQAKRDERASISRMSEIAEKKKIEYDAVLEEFGKSMEQFQKLDIDPDDINKVQQIEERERKVIVDALTKHEGNIVQFMRSGGKMLLSQYANKVRNSMEYKDAVQQAQWYKLASDSIQKGETPHDVNIGTPDAPEFVPANIAIKLRKEGKVAKPLAWTGSYKPMNFGDIVPLLGSIVNELEVPRQLHPNELRTLLRKQNQSESHVKKMVEIYETTMFDPNNPTGIGKHGLNLPENKLKVEQKEAAKDRASRERMNAVSNQPKPQAPQVMLSQIAFNPNNLAPTSTFQKSSMAQVFNGQVMEVRTYNTPKEFTDRIKEYVVGKRPTMMFHEDAQGNMIPFSLTGNASASYLNPNGIKQANENGKGILQEANNWTVTEAKNETKIVYYQMPNGIKQRVLNKVYVEFPDANVKGDNANQQGKIIANKIKGSTNYNQAHKSGKTAYIVEMWVPVGDSDNIIETIDQADMYGRSTKAFDMEEAFRRLGQANP